MGRAKSSSPLDSKKKKKQDDEIKNPFQKSPGHPFHVSLARTGLRHSCKPIEEYWNYHDFFLEQSRFTSQLDIESPPLIGIYLKKLGFIRQSAVSAAGSDSFIVEFRFI